MNKHLAWMSAVALVLSIGSVAADEHVDGEDVNENAAFGIGTSNEARDGGVDGLAKAGEALALEGGDNTARAEATIDLISDADANTPEAVTAGIPASDELPDEAAFGHRTATDARDGGVDGLAIAEDAMGQADALIDDALGSREIPARPDQVPEVPEPPIG